MQLYFKFFRLVTNSGLKGAITRKNSGIFPQRKLRPASLSNRGIMHEELSSSRSEETTLASYIRRVGLAILRVEDFPDDRASRLQNQNCQWDSFCSFFSLDDTPFRFQFQVVTRRIWWNTRGEGCEDYGNEAHFQLSMKYSPWKENIFSRNNGVTILSFLSFFLSFLECNYIALRKMVFI